MEFYNRNKEKQRLQKVLSDVQAKLIVIYGRRRCGKSTLIKKVIGQNDFYYMAEQSDEAIQRANLAKVIGEKIKGFDSVVYPNWESLFNNLNNSLNTIVTLCIDELPYLVKSSSSFPSLLQRFIDNTVNRKFHLILCGSSQQMMRGIALDSTSPLYGRANEILKITPLEAGWLDEALNCSSVQAVVEYSVWGGVPRYWELRKDELSFEASLKNIVLDRLGVLHEEPTRLFLDDMRESVQAYSILSLVGGGCNRISEIASRLNKPASGLSGPIDNLIQLGYLKREIPFGESEKSGKRSLYRISDPFMNFYFTFVVSNLSRLEMGLTELVYEAVNKKLTNYVSFEWENLCRRCVPVEPFNGVEFDMAYRWWGNNINGEPMEIDLVAESLDKKTLLIAECKWSSVSDSAVLLEKLKLKARLLPFVNDKKIIVKLFVKETSKNSPDIVKPEEVIARLKL